MSGTGKRSFVRIPIAVRINFNFVEPSKREDIIREITSGGEDPYKDIEAFSRLLIEKHKLQETKEVNTLILDFLVYIKRKLDELELILKDQKRASEFANKAITVDLGGGGLAFEWEEPIPPGSYLDILIDVPLFPKQGIRALGKVVTCDKERNRNIVRVSFDYIKEDDREDLIKFVFIKQREILARRSLGRA